MDREFVTAMIASLKRRISSKRTQYETSMKFFKACVNNESETDCFERNAISTLVAMMETKTQIQEMESHLNSLELMLMRAEDDNG